jgi:hypothetical protein
MWKAAALALIFLACDIGVLRVAGQNSGPYVVGAVDLLIAPEALDAYLFAVKENASDTVKEPGNWPAPGSEDTKFGVTMGPEVGHGEAEVYAGVQA